MKKCSFFSCFYKLLNCFKNYSKVPENSYELANDKNKNKNIEIIQLSTSNEYLPQGNYKNLENYDLFYSFINKPLVKIYLNEIFYPNKELMKFQYQKIKGIYQEIKPEIDSLFKRYEIDLFIPTETYTLSTLSYTLEGEPATQKDLDCYTPIFFLELWLYPKSFIKQSKLKTITFLHNIDYTTCDYTQEREGCPDSMVSKSLVLSANQDNFAYIRIVLHHEFFHFIDYIDDHTYKDPDFGKLNQPGFKYGKGGDSERVWIKLDKNLMGFINHYSTTALEEDKAEIYQYLIGDPDQALNNKDIIVQRKAKFIQKFINKFDKYGIGDINNNFWNNLIDFRRKFPYKESVFNGNVVTKKKK